LEVSPGGVCDPGRGRYVAVAVGPGWGVPLASFSPRKKKVKAAVPKPIGPLASLNIPTMNRLAGPTARS
jgi:hypothetical protein